jgi:hypothetical protein
MVQYGFGRLVYPAGTPPSVFPPVRGGNKAGIRRIIAPFPSEELGGARGVEIRGGAWRRERGACVFRRGSTRALFSTFLILGFDLGGIPVMLTVKTLRVEDSD